MAKMYIVTVLQKNEDYDEGFGENGPEIYVDQNVFSDQALARDAFAKAKQAFPDAVDVIYTCAVVREEAVEYD